MLTTWRARSKRSPPVRSDEMRAPRSSLPSSVSDTSGERRSGTRSFDCFRAKSGTQPSTALDPRSSGGALILSSGLPVVLTGRAVPNVPRRP